MELGILFDMDGVIIDSNPFHKLALDQFMDQKGLHLSEEDRKKKLYGRANKDWINDLYDGKLSDEELLQLGSEKEAIFRDLYKGQVTEVKGLRQFLKTLQNNQVPYCIGTSAPLDNVDFVLNELNLSSDFKTILHQDHVKKGKPNPEIYINCAKAIGLPPSSCIVIEDSLSGVKAGKDAGCKVIGITTTHTEEELSEVDYIIQDFDDLTYEILIGIRNKDN